MAYSYEKEVRSLLKRLTDNKYELEVVDNGEESVKVKSRNDAVEHIMSVDISTLIVRKNSLRLCLCLILGNDPGELVADYSVDPELDKLVELHSEQWL